VRHHYSPKTTDGKDDVANSEENENTINLI
jgi:hypothetical protein